MLPVVDETGVRTSRQAGFFSVLLVGVTLLPVMTGLAGWLYGSAALGLGGWFMLNSIGFARRTDEQSARRLFLASVCYLPILMALLLADSIT
jgi:protoheme IX farnesyltransferase